MRKEGIVIASFDPITRQTLQELKQIQKREHLQVLYVWPQEEGILPFDVRLNLLQKATKPYNKLIVYQASHVPSFSVSTDDEEKVRQGSFYLAAPGIQNVLVSQGYYFEEIVKAHCKPKRAGHSFAVAKLCEELANAHGLDAKKAYQAGLLHDITKDMSDDENRRILELYQPDKLSLSPKVWHSYSARSWLKQNLGLYDEEILHAIDCHTIGNGTSSLDHILYIADKCEPTRGYDSTKEIALSKKDLKEGAKLVLEEAHQYILEKEGVDVRNS